MSDPSINPYEPPSVDSQLGIEPKEQSIEQIRRRVSRPGTALLIMGSIASVFPGIAIVGWLFNLFFVGFNAIVVPNLLVSLLFFACTVMISIGGGKMASMESYRLARFGAILACIPLVTPFIFLGIPFGIWALVLLHDPEVKAAFAAMSKFWQGRRDV
ncbi:MAG: hypothetical protein ACKO9Q_06050 [Pirellula sp.]